MRRLSEKEYKLLRFKSFRALGVLFILFLLVISGCSSEQKKAPQPSKAVKKAPVKTAKSEAEKPAVAVGEKEESFPGYTATTLKDPFEPFLKEEVVAVRRKGALSPLEKFDLGELTLSGILIKGSEAVALIEDNEGKGYTVKKGVKIGKNGGVITKITKNEVFIIEEYYDLTGRKITKEKMLALPQPGGE